MGLSFVDHERDLPNAIMNALSFADAAVVEARIDGPEVAVGMIGGVHDAYPLIEIVPKSRVSISRPVHPPAPPSTSPPRACPRRSAGGAAPRRPRPGRPSGSETWPADLMFDGEGLPWIVNVNVSPGMTDTSLLPMAAAAAGVAFDDLCERVLEIALGRAAPGT